MRPCGARCGQGAPFEGGQALADLVELGEVVGSDDLALHDGEVDLGLVEPARVHQQVDQSQARPLCLQAIDRGLATVRRAIVHDPEHPLGRHIRLGRHDLLDKAPEREDAGGLLAASHDNGAMHVIGGQVGERASSVVLVLDADQARPTQRQPRMAVTAGLDAGLSSA